MDTLTHIVLGACTGEALIGKKTGKKALWIGALANSIPDADAVTAIWLDEADYLLAHRGFSHSILFALAVSFLLAYICGKRYLKDGISYQRWFIFFIIEIGLHLFLDSLNAYGTGLFEPFSHDRVSFNTIFVADPFFSFGLGIAFLALLILRSHDKSRRYWLLAGVGLTCFYLLYCMFNKVKTDTIAKGALRAQQITYEQYFTTPTPFNNWLWYVVAGDEKGWYMGYYSVLAGKNSIDFHYFPRNDTLLEPIRQEEEVQDLLRFSQGFYTVSKKGDSLVFNDLRFGQIAGWHDPDAGFVFHYYPQRPGSNKLALQRGRFSHWNRETVHSLLRRIRGD